MLEEIVVNSMPTGAKIFVDGVAVAETPETIKVGKGTTKTVVLKKEGFADETATIDPQKSRKLLVRLERLKKAAPPSGKPLGSKPSKLSLPPPVAPAAPVVARPVAPAPQAHPPVKKKYVDPYERVDEPKKGTDVLNPY